MEMAALTNAVQRKSAGSKQPRSLAAVVCLACLEPPSGLLAQIQVKTS